MPDAITIEANASGKLWSDDPQRWQDLTTPAGCPICARPPPADHVVAETERCWVTADEMATLPGYVCVTAKHHAVEPYELAKADQVGFFSDCMAVAKAVAGVLRPVKMNYEIHGNTIPHLHMHLFPRTPEDPYVGFVITNRVWFRRSREELDQLGAAIRAALR